MGKSADRACEWYRRPRTPSVRVPSRRFVQQLCSTPTSKADACDSHQCEGALHCPCTKTGSLWWTPLSFDRTSGGSSLGVCARSTQKNAREGPHPSLNAEASGRDGVVTFRGTVISALKRVPHVQNNAVELSHVDCPGKASCIARSLASLLQLLMHSTSRSRYMLLPRRPSRETLIVVSKTICSAGSVQQNPRRVMSAICAAVAFW
eukprot:6211880-Pleurochrysis_carterae.AAC.2